MRYKILIIVIIIATIHINIYGLFNYIFIIDKEDEEQIRMLYNISYSNNILAVTGYYTADDFALNIYYGLNLWDIKKTGSVSDNEGSSRFSFKAKLLHDESKNLFSYLWIFNITIIIIILILYYECYSIKKNFNKKIKE